MLCAGNRRGQINNDSPQNTASLFLLDTLGGHTGGQTGLRSYSICNCIGGYDVLDNSGRYKTKTSQVTTHSQVFVFIDEHESSIDDGALAMRAPPDQSWLNLPSSRHQGGVVLSFLNGHVERWKWKAGSIPFRGAPAAALPNELADLQKLQDATPTP